MTDYTWANPDHSGVITISSGRVAFLDSGPEYDAAVAAGPNEYAGPLDVVAPGPDAETALASERAAMVCSRFQAKAALHLAGLLDTIEAVVAAADPVAKIAWADAADFRRDSPTIAALAAGAGLTDAQIDDLFRVAMTITA